MTFFVPDVNVWLALLFDAHVHNRRADDWFDGLAPGQAAFCRITQLGLLRLLTQPAVMGKAVLQITDAWRAYDAIASDERVTFLEEPDRHRVDMLLREATRRSPGEHRHWTDSYLAALARASGYVLVTFDKRLARQTFAGARLLGG